MGTVLKLKKHVHFFQSVVNDSIAAWKIRRFVRNGFKPWSTGYSEYKEMSLQNILRQEHLLDVFRADGLLPKKFGYRLDERAVEYPWLFSRLNNEKKHLLDAGSALNFAFLLTNRWLKSRDLVIYTLSPEQVIKRSNISYVYGDLRQTVLKGECFDEIVSISTLEHIGMNNRILYTNKDKYNEFQPDSVMEAVLEFKRLLKPGGKLFITVPFGYYQNLGWLQQFDSEMISRMIEAFNGSRTTETYFKYHNDGWQLTNAADSSDCRYFDVHNQPTFETDFLAAARAVACIEIIK